MFPVTVAVTGWARRSVGIKLMGTVYEWGKLLEGEQSEDRKADGSLISSVLSRENRL
jgi:hypothetical protein